MPSLSPEILARLKQADKLPHQPRPREFLLGAPARALQRAHTLTFDALAERGVRALDR